MIIVLDYFKYNKSLFVLDIKPDDWCVCVGVGGGYSLRVSSDPFFLVLEPPVTFDSLSVLSSFSSVYDTLGLKTGNCTLYQLYLKG